MASINVSNFFTIFYLINLNQEIIYCLRGNWAIYAYITPIINPNNPKALPKISTTKILINVLGSYASANTQLLPDTPTHTPHIIFESPTPIPVHNKANDECNTYLYISGFEYTSLPVPYIVIFSDIIIDIITP